MLPGSETVHTFINPGVGVLAGADWDRKDVIDALRKAGTIELTGEQAQRMNHGIAIQRSVNDWLFIETARERLEVGEFTITRVLPSNTGGYWIARTRGERTGEGMEVSAKEFIVLVEEFFNKEL